MYSSAPAANGSRSCAAVAYSAGVNFAVCPDDGTHLKAVQRRPLLLTCPVCAKQFEFTDQGIVEVPAGGAGPQI